MGFKCDDYLCVIAAIETEEREAARAKRKQHGASRIGQIEKRYCWFAIVGSLMLAILVAFVGRLFKIHWFFVVGWVLLFVSYLAAFLWPFINVWLYRHSLKRFWAAPFFSLVESNVKVRMKIDAKYLPELMKLSSETLKLGIVELKVERAALEKRAHLVAGVLDKVGIFPGLLALIIGISKLVGVANKAGITIGMEWVLGVAVANIVLFLMCGCVQVMLVRYDRMISITEQAIELKAKASVIPGRYAVKRRY